MERIVERVMEKREFRYLNRSFVERVAREKAREIGLAHLNTEDEKQLRIFVKEVRKELRKLVGMFEIAQTKRKRFVSEKDFEKLLATHASTKERLGQYDKVRKLVYRRHVKSVLDLGCGLNPIALSKKGVKYIACDVNKSVLELVRKYFEARKLDGEVRELDVCDFESLKKLPEADIVLAFKLLDIVCTPGKRWVAGRIIENVRGKEFIVSFATRKLSGKKMNMAKRYWFEKILKSLGASFERVFIPGEIFYIFSVRGKNICTT